MSSFALGSNSARLQHVKNTTSETDLKDFPVVDSFLKSDKISSSRKSNISKFANCFLSRFNFQYKMTGVGFIIFFGTSFVLFPCQGRT